ncbi:hypothetical protein LUZ60_011560 [Juncus effusus]|nr:hypothetical protein LUZ60_011560 [Juncus effusus]
MEEFTCQTNFCPHAVGFDPLQSLLPNLHFILTKSFEWLREQAHHGLNCRERERERERMADKKKQRKWPQNMPWTDRVTLSLYSLLRDFTRRPDGTVNRRLLSFFDPRVPASSNPVHGVSTFDLTIDASRELFVRVFSPSNSNPTNNKCGNLKPVIVYFHGGGFSFFSPSSRRFDALCHSICREICAVVISVNYRLAPEHKCPAQYNDGIDILKFLDSGQIGSASSVASGLKSLDLRNCFLAGDSAGGNIIHHVARQWASHLDDWKKIRVAGIMSIQPAFGGEDRTDSEIRLEGVPVLSMASIDWTWKAFLPEGADRNHDAVNVFDSIETGIEAAFPPVLVVVGGFDPLFDWQKRYYETLKEKEKKVKLVEYPNAIHAFYLFEKYEETQNLLKEMKSFVEENRSIMENF